MFKVGDKVRFISDKMHTRSPQFYPPVGTIGEVVSLESMYNYTATIRWPKEITSGIGEWGVKDEWVELLTEIKEEPVEVKPTKLLVKAPIRAITIGDTITIKGKRYKYIEDGSKAVVLSISDKTIVCLVKDGGLFTIDKKDCRLVDVEAPAETEIVVHEKKGIEVGDRVVAVENYIGTIEKGDTGTVVSKGNAGWLWIDWDRYVDGHDCSGKARNGHGYGLYKRYVKLIEEKPAPRDTNFTVGEWVRIRDWEDMEREFGLDENGNIKTRKFPMFTKYMKHLCGMYMHMSSIGENGQVGFDNELHGINYKWYFNIDMIEKIPTYKAGDKVRVRSIEALKQNFGDPVKLPNDNGWNRGMDYHCGNVYEVKNINKDGGNELSVGEIYLFSKFAVEKVS